jgi:hypothetical protein
MINENVLKYIMNLAVSDASFFQVKAIAHKVLIDIKESKSKFSDSNSMYYISLIDQYLESPEKFKLQVSPKIPDGSPIGSDICNYNAN